MFSPMGQLSVLLRTLWNPSTSGIFSRRHPDAPCEDLSPGRILPYIEYARTLRSFPPQRTKIPATPQLAWLSYFHSVVQKG